MTKNARPTIEEILARRKPRTETVQVPIDMEILDRISDLRDRIAAQRQADEMAHEPPKTPALEAELEVLEEEASLVTADFTFQELPRPEFHALIAANPPKGDGKSSRWNEDTFGPALIAACCIDPAMTLDQAEQIWATWNEASTFLLFGKAWQVNEAEFKVPFFARSIGTMRGSPRSSTSVSAKADPSSTPSS